MQKDVEVNQNSWENIINYYIQCYEKEISRNASFPWESVDKNYISLNLDECPFFSSEETILNVKQFPKLERFLKKLYYRGRARKLYLSYPQVITGSGNKQTINPIFIHEVNFEVDSSNRMVSFELENPYPELNIGILYQQGLSTEEIILINNEVTDIFREPIENESPKDQFFRALKKALLHLDINTNVFNPKKLKTGMIELSKQKVLNDALIYWGETSYFYQSMMSELQQLKNISYEDVVTKTSLSYLIGNKIIKKSKFSESIFQIIPLDEFQEDAIKASLNQPFTVITGPPGTGKSQVLVNLIVNALINDKSVLFASKNNKAVDVVYERLEKLVENSLVIRSGSRKARLAALEDLKIKLRLINEFAGSHKFDKTVENANEIISQIRLVKKTLDKLDQLEDSLEKVKEELKQEEYSSCYQNVCQKAECRRKIETLFDDLERLREHRTLLERIHDIFVKVSILDKKYQEIMNVSHKCSPKLFSKLQSLEKEKAIDVLYKQFEYCDLLTKQEEILNQLKLIPVRKELTKTIVEKRKKLLAVSLNVYQQKWLALVNNSNSSIATIQKYVQIQEDLLSENRGFKKLYGILKQKSEQVFEELLTVLPIWGVTNLSPKLSFPFKQNLFDLIVIDEASQCDIASAIPLLYRAKKAVIIGDPNQLPHITPLTKQQDIELISKNKIEKFYPDLSYKQYSLYGLAEDKYLKNNLQPITLKGHYRSHPDIIGFSKKYFYGNLELRNNSYSKNGGVSWFNCIGNPKRLGPGQILNMNEAVKTIQILESIIQKLGNDKTYGIITPFRRQVEELTNLMMKKSKMEGVDVIIDTVHKFQGDERDVIIFSPVIGESLPESTNHFVDKEGNLLNVTVTRAREQFLVVGNLEFARQRNSYIGKLAKYIESVGEVTNI